MAKRWNSVWLLLLWGLCGLAWAGPLEQPDQPGYRLGTGDLIEISVFGVSDYTYQVRIGSSGLITLPYVGEIEATGLTTEQLGVHLEEAMRGHLFKDPKVTVKIQEYRAHPVIVLGAVSRPGTYHDTSGNLTLLDLLGEAGGLAENAGEEIVVQRFHGSDPEPEVLRIRRQDLMERAVLSLNIPLQGGDVVTVPASDGPPTSVFYVIGEVAAPGKYELPVDVPVLATQAIAAAGGPLRTAKTGKGILMRYLEDGSQRQLAVNFKKMLKGQAPDVQVQSQDIIFIPGSNIKTIGYGMLGIIPQTVQQTATSGRVRP